jgi:hypothetical protein
MNIYTLQTPKACPLIGIFCMNMQKIHKSHRLLGVCGALRIKKNFETGLDSEWSAGMKETIKEALEMKVRMTGADYERPPPEVGRIEARAERLLSVEEGPFHRKLRAFIRRLRKWRGSIVPFSLIMEQITRIKEVIPNKLFVDTIIFCMIIEVQEMVRWNKSGIELSMR